MYSETVKEELIQWITQLNDELVIQKLFSVKKQQTGKKKKRTFGCGKGIFTYVAPDFNEPLSEFQEYGR